MLKIGLKKALTQKQINSSNSRNRVWTTWNPIYHTPLLLNLSYKKVESGDVLRGQKDFTSSLRSGRDFSSKVTTHCGQLNAYRKKWGWQNEETNLIRGKPLQENRINLPRLCFIHATSCVFMKAKNTRTCGKGFISWSQWPQHKEKPRDSESSPWCWRRPVCVASSKSETTPCSDWQSGFNKCLTITRKYGGKDMESRWEQRKVTRQDPWGKPVLLDRTLLLRPPWISLVLGVTNPTFQMLSGNIWLAGMS